MLIGYNNSSLKHIHYRNVTTSQAKESLVYMPLKKSMKITLIFFTVTS